MSPSRQVCRGACALMLALLAAGCTGGASEPASPLEGFTGSHTRVVWVQGDGTDPFAFGRNLVLMGRDSRDPAGERVILGERDNYMKPLLTPSGGRIVFSRNLDAGSPEVFIVNWDGTGLARLGAGFALGTWLNPIDDSEWVYVGQEKDGHTLRRVVRYPIDRPQDAELVWDKTPVSADTFQVSADGRFAAGQFPWPEVGIAELPNGGLVRIGDGCWTAMQTVRGPLAWYFDGAHRNLTLVDQQTDKRWTVAINTAPGFDNPEVYHPRWTNHPRFVALSGPYNRGGANQVRSGGTQSEVWLGRFSEDFSSVEAWFKVTDNQGGDSYPDVWIERKGNPHAARPSGPVGPASATPSRPSSQTGVHASRVVVQGRVVHAGPIPAPQSILPYRHALVVNEYDVLSVIDGTIEPRRVRVAEWVIRDSQVIQGAARRAGEERRLVIERYDAHPELEGERLITDLSASDQPLYYAVAK